VVFDGVAREAVIVHRDQIVDGVEVSGPAIVLEPTSTGVVPPGWTVRVGPAGALLLSRSHQL
jgi:N-methylhydantoinase A/oxoprolinase/acetone carboxylase beta subunit